MAGRALQRVGALTLSVLGQKPAGILTLPEHAEREFDDEQKYTAARREPQDLRQEALVQRRRALFPEDRREPGRGASRVRN